MSDDLNILLEKILTTIRLDVNNIFTQACGSKALEPEYQDALVKYYKLLSDARLASKERALEEKMALIEASLPGGAVPKA